LIFTGNKGGTFLPGSKYLPRSVAGIDRHEYAIGHISPPDGETDQAGFAPNQFFFVYSCDSAKNYRNINASITLLI
jgi:hypothetical protein